ncbi:MULTISPECIES: nucleoside hydrolase [Eubacteriales]|uniref:Ribosylpyrimidine nucleosidase/non-specific riboncleoside hydrolase n=1 Tax=Bittarella massiliensis (ex Durand et al. 2017) TaxID=1720313 RepID=A0AAQ1MD74_9FIRM|nr:MULTISPECIES: nucleoside hydrolase [Eubacteriales]ERI96614.1 putative cytidine/uridine-specific hydrolase [Clostridium sp. ATCC 29733]SHG05829.1 ribosylpyrimidine nucleosidase/non-specific riboncleoside hydrolase [Bittarella massiliensis (ex Durand et al. 2017)]
MKPIPVILDVDTGVDDAVAITLAARCRSIKLLGLVASFGNRPLHYTLRNTLWLKELLALEVPVCKGAASPLCQPDHPEPEDSEHIFHGKEGMGNAVPPPSLATAPDSDDPVAFLADLLEKSEEPVALVPVGPLTNLARLVTARPDLIPKIRVISLMGGAAKGGNVTPYSEVNIYNDPEAAATVFACGAPIIMCGLDCTRDCYLTDGERAQLRQTHRDPLSQILCDGLEGYAASNARFGENGVVHDALAVGCLAYPELLHTSPYYVDICLTPGEHRGQTVVDWEGATGRAANVQVGLRADRDLFVWLVQKSFEGAF